MTLDDRARRGRLVTVATLGAMVLANMALAVALVREALAAKTVVVVPGVSTARETTANEPPPEAVRDFVLLYLAQFDNYTPATVEETTRTIEGWLSPRFFAQASDALARRKDLALQSRMASQILLPRREEAQVRRTETGEFEVTIVAVRRVYIADKLQSETPLVYTVAIETGTPTLQNPYGLYVTGQRVAPAGKENRHEKGD